MRELIEQETRMMYNKVKKERYLYGNKPGRYLAQALEKKKSANYIDKIQTGNGEFAHKSVEIAKTFKEYYASLYDIGTKDEVEQKRVKIKTYLRESGLKKITEEQINQLETPITEEEITKTIRETPMGKSPGPDGLTILYYRKFKDILIPKMCNLMNRIGDKEELRKEALEATIIVIPKEGKDGTLCSSYRPISLLNLDTKIYAKILADRLKKVMQKIIHPDQVGFITGREGKDNGTRTLLVIQEMKGNGALGLLLSTDAEKHSTG